MSPQRLWLRRTHVGYYRIALSVTLAHVALGVDSFLPGRHNAPVFHFVQPLLASYGLMHFGVAAALVFALWADERWWWVARWSFLLSVITFNTFAAGLLFGFAFYGGSLIGSVGLIALSISSAAAWREPTIGPAYRSISHRAT